MPSGGSTTYGAEQLFSTTAISTPFKVYGIYVCHYKEFEKAIHKKLALYRTNSKRGFFKVFIDKAIEIMNDESVKLYYKTQDNYVAIKILPKLIAKYSKYIDPNIVSARIYQEMDRVYLLLTITPIKEFILTRVIYKFIIILTYIRMYRE